MFTDWKIFDGYRVILSKDWSGRATGEPSDSITDGKRDNLRDGSRALFQETSARQMLIVGENPILRGADRKNKCNRKKKLYLTVLFSEPP